MSPAPTPTPSTIPRPTPTPTRSPALNHVISPYSPVSSPTPAVMGHRLYLAASSLRSWIAPACVSAPPQPSPPAPPAGAPLPATSSGSASAEADGDDVEARSSSEIASRAGAREERYEPRQAERPLRSGVVWRRQKSLPSTHPMMLSSISAPPARSAPPRSATDGHSRAYGQFRDGGDRGSPSSSPSLLPLLLPPPPKVPLLLLPPRCASVGRSVPYAQRSLSLNTSNGTSPRNETASTATKVALPCAPLFRCSVTFCSSSGSVSSSFTTSTASSERGGNRRRSSCRWRTPAEVADDTPQPEEEVALSSEHLNEAMKARTAKTGSSSMAARAHVYSPRLCF
mmetsp:Transcript_28461/g.92965  ORF Transcript_28461/g.92965 Transcript_28461/m.92965 type:complete len:341 (-) Transcript_28461:156-1178(-)